jgi:hypothetical protein
MNHTKNNYNWMAASFGLIGYYIFLLIQMIFRIGNLKYTALLLVIFFGICVFLALINQRRFFIILSQGFGFVIAFLVIIMISELFTETERILFISSGLSLIIMTVFIFAHPLSRYHHPKLSKNLIFFFIITMAVYLWRELSFI